VNQQYSDSNIRQVIRHSAKRILLAGKSAVVKYAYDGNKLYAIYDSGDGQQAAYEVQVKLLSVSLESAGVTPREGAGD
jgi:hypothetical protein